MYFAVFGVDVCSEQKVYITKKIYGVVKCWIIMWLLAMIYSKSVGDRCQIFPRRHWLAAPRDNIRVVSTTLMKAI